MTSREGVMTSREGVMTSREGGDDVTLYSDKH